MSRSQSPEPLPFEPDFVAGLKRVFERDIPFNRLLGLQIDELSGTSVSGHLAMQPALIGHYLHERLHGGVVSASLDAMGGLAAMAAIGARHMAETPTQRLQRFAKLGTIDLRVDYLRPAVGDRFALRAQVLRLGSRVASTRMEFFDPQGKLLATGAAAYMVS